MKITDEASGMKYLAPKYYRGNRECRAVGGHGRSGRSAREKQGIDSL